MPRVRSRGIALVTREARCPPSERQQHVERLLAVAGLLHVGELAAGRRRRCGASAILALSITLSLSMSSGRTTPATASSRSSKLTRTSWRPSMTRLPLGSTPVTTAATLVSSTSERRTDPAPCEELSEEALSSESALTSLGKKLGNLPSSPNTLAAPRALARLARALGRVVEGGAVGHAHAHGEDVAHLRRPLVLEERPRPRPPQRGAGVGEVRGRGGQGVARQRRAGRHHRGQPRRPCRWPRTGPPRRSSRAVGR